MRTPFLTLFLLIAAQALVCGKGGLQCEQNSCHYPTYIEGCLTYAIDNSCARCEYSKFVTIQTISCRTDSATIPPSSTLNLAVSPSMPIADAVSVLADSSSIQPVTSAKTSKSTAVCKKDQEDATSAHTVTLLSFRL